MGLTKSLECLEESLVPSLNFLSRCNREKLSHSLQCLGGTYGTRFVHRPSLLSSLCPYCGGCRQTLLALPTLTRGQRWELNWQQGVPHSLDIMQPCWPALPSHLIRASFPAYTQHLVYICVSLKPELFSTGCDKTF